MEEGDATAGDYQEAWEFEDIPSFPWVSPYHWMVSRTLSLPLPTPQLPMTEPEVYMNKRKGKQPVVSLDKHLEMEQIKENLCASSSHSNHSPDDTITSCSPVDIFKELKDLVSHVDFRGALGSDVAPWLLYLSNVLRHSAISEAQSSLLDNLMSFLNFQSDIFNAISVQNDESLYIDKYDSAKLKVEETISHAKRLQYQAMSLRASATSIMYQISKLQEEMDNLMEGQIEDVKELAEIRDLITMDIKEITPLAQWLLTESDRRIIAGKRLKDAKECLTKGQHDWVIIQNGFEQFGS